MVLAQAVRLGGDAPTRFAALLHDLGKGTTPAAEWPRHVGHEARGVELIRSLCARLRVPAEFRDLALLVAQYHTHVHRAFELRADTLLTTLERLDALRRPQRFAQVLLACEADARGRLGFEDSAYPQARLFAAARECAAAVAVQPLLERGLKGEALAAALRSARIQAIAALEKTVSPAAD